ncbi:hypothetical protein [Pseudomonas chlororaphis]|uniref:hypothetical protein n=1 Tax=Pseudomonas chlororaphis TaxID=587753 RepID=UPI0024087FE9|nr:hypothetical protein [Pseudomonas chlororaphis]
MDQKIPLTWADGKPIIAYGNPVYAFASTPEQFNDSGLFNGLGKGYYGELTAAEKWKQYGKAQAEAYSKEILDFSSNNLASKNAADRILTLAVKNTESVSIIDDVILSLGGVVGGKATLKTILEAVAERRATKKVAAAEAVLEG